MKKGILLFIAVLLFGASEPSAFEAGNLDSPNPYGLTPAEKKIFNNAQEIKQLKKRLFNVEQKLSSVEEKVDGLQSVVEGIDETLNKLKKEGGSKEVQTEIVQLRQDLNVSLELQKKNFDQIKKVLKEMSTLIDHINNTYVSKSELKSELNKIYTLLHKKKIESKSGSKLYQEARSAYKRGKYVEAYDLFVAAAQKKYKPAASNFYAGESCYYQKKYDCAVEHYKKSASLYQNASYMPTLLLHTAVSLERLGQKEEAKKFYSSVVKLYPKSKAAAIAKKNLKKLK